jgi:di/tricarboxylate transporter
MTQDLAIVLGLLAAAVTMFALGRPRGDVVGLLMLVALPATGVVETSEALAGFSDPTVILMALLFVVGEALVRTGIARRAGDWLAERAGSSEGRLVAMLMAIVTTTGSFMSSTGVVALFIPVVTRIAHRSAIAASRLFMPLSIAALVSGMMTLVATPPNLMVHAELVRSGHAGFGLFDFTPFGVPILAMAIAYVLCVRRWLGQRRHQLPGSEAAAARRHIHQWIEEYALAGRESRLRVRPDSSLVGQALKALDLRAREGINVLAVERAERFGRRLVHPTADTVLAAGDVLLLDVFEPDTDLEALARRFGLEPLPLSAGYFADRRQDIGMAELIVPDQSTLVGKTLEQARFRSVHDLVVIGLKRGSRPRLERLSRIPLQVGDTLLVVGTWRAIRKLAGTHRDVVVASLPAELDEAAPAGSRALPAIATLALMVALMASGAVPNVLAALVACLLLGLFRCIDMASAYRSIHWQTLLLIVGMLPFALALQRTGGIDLATGFLLRLTGEASPRLVLAALFATTTVLGLFISNTATAILMAPIALSVASGLDASPYPFAMTVALASSAAFMTPVSSPVNLLVVGPGGYSFMDFLRIGVPLAILTGIVCVVLVPWLLPP